MGSSRGGEEAWNEGFNLVFYAMGRSSKPCMAAGVNW